VTDPGESRTHGTRRQIMGAAAREFAQRAYSMVSLDDIIARAGVSKGAMYFHFQSKQALAMAIIDEESVIIRHGLTERLGQGLSGLETLIEASYFLAAQDIRSDDIRAGLNLLEEIGRNDRMHAKVLTVWSPAIAEMVQRGIADGDIIDGTVPEAVSRLLMSIYLGLRQAADFDAPQEFLTNLEHAWQLMLPGLANADRLAYFGQFVKRCTAVAKKDASLPHSRS
jgi:TetR/AcrR family transcriptional regulator, transcriptional repressor for nem operon